MELGLACAPLLVQPLWDWESFLSSPLAEDENRLLNYLEAARLPKCINYFSKESGHVASVESAAIMY